MIYVGETTASKFYIGSTAVSNIYVGSEAVWSSFVAMGINKNGGQSISSGTWTLVTNWVARSGYPDTVITSNGLEIPAGATVTLTGQTQHGGSSTGNACRIIADGTVLATSVSSSTSTPSVSVTYTPTVTSLVQLQVFANGLTATRAISSGANTYLVAQP
ncbi:hypothetical protein [Rhodococcus sp. 05-2255-1e]|uniref:hypothetical protein n=1 Tax=Rhodococcus sp. 05-2255-1e TaxID=2022495 RepID=UPI00117BADD8|nr:hypothetical protein [Rhodococcus sp. 05-2255-1e]